MGLSTGPATTDPSRRHRGTRGRRPRARAALRHRHWQRLAVRGLGLQPPDVGWRRTVRHAAADHARGARRLGVPRREPRRVGRRRSHLDAALQSHRGPAVPERRRRPLPGLVSAHLRRPGHAPACAAAAAPRVAVAGRGGERPDARRARHCAAVRADPARHRREAAGRRRDAGLSRRGPVAPVLRRRRPRHHRLAPGTRVGSARPQPRAHRHRRRDLQLHREHGDVRRRVARGHLLARERARHGRRRLAAAAPRRGEQSRCRRS